jgi:hypothetical protein
MVVVKGEPQDEFSAFGERGGEGYVPIVTAVQLASRLNADCFLAVLREPKNLNASLREASRHINCLVLFQRGGQYAAKLIAYLIGHGSQLSLALSNSMPTCSDLSRVSSESRQQ